MFGELETTTNYNHSSHSPLLTRMLAKHRSKNTFLMFICPLNVLIFCVCLCDVGYGMYLCSGGISTNVCFP